MSNNFEFEFKNIDEVYDIPNRSEQFRIRFNEEKHLEDISLEYGGGAIWFLVWEN